MSEKKDIEIKVEISDISNNTKKEKIKLIDDENLKYDINDLKMLYNIIYIYTFTKDNNIFQIKYEVIDEYNFENMINILKKIDQINTNVDILFNLLICKNKFFVIDKEYNEPSGAIIR